MSICYINGNEVWFNGRAFGWSKNTLKDVFRAAKKDQDVSEISIALGSEVSYVVAVRTPVGESIDRRKVLKIAAANLPFVPVDEGFDWQKISFGEGDDWMQIAAIEPDFLKLLTESAKTAGIKILSAVPAAVVLAGISEDKEAPVLIKWQGKEKVSVLAVRGLVDFVGTEPDEKINAYARHRWNLAVNPEQIVLSDDEFDFGKEFEALSNKGEDSEVMEIEVEKEVVAKRGLVRLISKEQRREGVTVETQTEPVWRSWIRTFAPIAIVIIFLGTLGIYAYQRALGPMVVEQSVVEEVAPSVTRVEATESALAEIHTYALLVLNGSGVTGEAARVRDDLISLGFSEVEIGNAPAISRTTIAYKPDVPGEILSRIVESLSEFEIGNLFALTSEKTYDVEIVIGSVRKE